MFAIATDATPGRPNEDCAVVTPELAVVVDGAGVPTGGCSHPVSWYAHQLAARTVAELVGDPDRLLRDGLAAGIAAVAALHADSCDLDAPGTPCAAIGILRIGRDTVETLSLSDVFVVVDHGDGPQVTVDLAIEELNGTEPEVLAGFQFGSPQHTAALGELVRRQTATRNRADGWWVAAANPQAASHALVNSYPRAGLHRAGILSDGAVRPVDQMRLYNWPEWADLADKLGPAGLIRRVRDIENDDPAGVQYPRTKRHDDATVAWFTQAS